MTIVHGSTKLDARLFGTDFAAGFAALPSGGTLVVPANVTVSETIVVPSGKNLWVEPSAIISSTHAGVAIDFEATVNGVSRVSVTKSTSRWFQGGETTSVGVRFVRAFDAEVTFDVVSNFGAAGVLFEPQNTQGISYNRFYLGQLVDNLVNLKLDQQGTGWVNENLFLGGRCRHSSSATDQAAGSSEIQISGNGNTFLAVTMEGSRAVRSLYCTGDYNHFIGCRFEAAAPIEFTATASRNMLIGGYGMLGQRGAQVNTTADVMDILDDGDHNLLLGTNALTLQSFEGWADNMGAAVEVRSTSDSRALMRGKLANGTTGFELKGRTIRLQGADGNLYDLTVNSQGKLLIGSTIVGTQT